MTTAVFDSAGRLIAVCTDFTKMQLVMMNPNTLQPIAIAPNGNLYVGVLNEIITIKDN